jgi:hypothetical protein
MLQHYPGTNSTSHFETQEIVIEKPHLQYAYLLVSSSPYCKYEANAEKLNVIISVVDIFLQYVKL